MGIDLHNTVAPLIWFRLLWTVSIWLVSGSVLLVLHRQFTSPFSPEQMRARKTLHRCHDLALPWPATAMDKSALRGCAAVKFAHKACYFLTDDEHGVATPRDSVATLNGLNGEHRRA